MNSVAALPGPDAVAIVRQSLLKDGYDPIWVLEQTEPLARKQSRILIDFVSMCELLNILDVDIIKYCRAQGIVWGKYTGDLLLLPGGCVLTWMESGFVPMSLILSGWLSINVSR